MIKSDITIRMFGTDEISVPAKKLLGYPGVETIEDDQPVTYYHLLFDQHELLCSSGMWSESLYLGEQTLKTLTGEQRAEILTLFPEFTCGEETHPARQIESKSPRLKTLVDRHAKNSKPLVS